MSNRKAWQHVGKESRHQRGYGAQHVRLRAQLLAQEPLCRLCAQKNPPRVTAATIADHITQIADLPPGAPLYDITNLQPVCVACHDAKTRADNGWKAPKAVIGSDGWPVE
ncbi:HNH endonuclease signature motif containing protein [Sphingobium sp. SA2]|uniref:HNH endonuclease signature motif containing protein n=1 Tax=Sphingobium sp. SA2 TaxID=1524832 RepID=UPI0028C094F9|nr:HNH endonuclease signature motif containing protein [Sphingobium sp. SA2]MDT7536172.1 HNH endonuclease signature motif containing protein [Sphingobium sp. SA2]